MEFKAGDKVEHVLSKDYLLVLEVYPESRTYICRTKDLRKVELLEFEVRSIRR
jgi:hypothetical protein